MARRTSHVFLAALVAASTLACGRKGPPQAPLRLAPAAPTEPSIKRVGDEIQLRIVLPTKNLQNQGRLELDHVEIYAVTVAPGTPVPPNRELLTPKYVVGKIDVKPPPGDDEPAPSESTAADKRPGPGETVTFVELVTKATLEPTTWRPKPVKGAPLELPEPGAIPAAAPPGAAAPTVVAPGTAAPGATAPAAAPGAVPAVPGAIAPVTPLPTYPVRVYTVRGMTKGSRPGAATARLQLPLVEIPEPPVGVKATYTETSILLEWGAPAGGATAPIGFDVYEGDAKTPINPKPIVVAPRFETPIGQFGAERCFAVRSMALVAGAPLESAAAPPSCVTPVDTFPPAPPKGVVAVARPGVVDLTWDANTEPDLGGYLVLRTSAADEPPMALTPAPIGDTHFLDNTVKPDVQYFYVIVAIDKSTPPNRSAPSPRYQITGK